MIGSIVYLLGALVSWTCAALLLRGYGRGRKALLLWSGLCFVGLGLSNFLVFIDLRVIGPEVSLYVPRLITAAIALAMLLYGLIWEDR